MQNNESGRAQTKVTSMFVEFSFSSITCFRIVREDLMASFNVMDWKNMVKITNI